MIEKALSLKVQTYRILKEAIISKRIRKDRIYSEQFFSDILQVSRTPVREALLQLRSEGFLDSLPNRGFIVRHLTEEDAKNIFQMRACIEGYCSENLANNINTPKGRKTLDVIDRSLEYSRYQMNHNMSIDQDNEMIIHEEVIRFTGNPMLIKQFNQMRAKIDVFWRDVISVPCRVAEVYNEHLRIADCMRAGDSIGAYQASHDHSTITLDKILEMAIFEKPGELRPAILGDESLLLKDII